MKDVQREDEKEKNESQKYWPNSKGQKEISIIPFPTSDGNHSVKGIEHQ